jgi:hypothetical protein
MFCRKGMAIVAACAAVVFAGVARAENASATSAQSAAAPSGPVYADDQSTTTPLMELFDDAGFGKTLENWGIKVTGLIEGSYTYNFEKPLQNPGGAPLPHTSVGRIFDSKNDAAILNQVDLRVERDIVADPNKWDVGGMMEWIYGHDADYIHANGLDFYGPGAGTTPDLQFDLTQLYVDFNIPVGNGLIIEAGKFVNFGNYEYIHPTDNALYSHSYLFNFSSPFTMSGVTGKYAFNDNWALMAGVIRGWNQSLKDTNGDNMSYIAQLQWASGDKKWTSNLNTIVGPEQAKNDSNWRYLLDWVLRWQYSDQLNFGFNGDFAYERHAALAAGDVGGDANWWGGAVYAGYKFDDRFTLNGRAEYFSDHYAARGLGTDVYEATVGLAITPFPDQHWLKGLLFRPEVRYDYSTKSGIFDGTEKNWQLTVGADAIYSF